MKVIAKILQSRKIRAFLSFHSLILSENDTHCPFIVWNGEIFAVTRDVKDFNFT